MKPLKKVSVPSNFLFFDTETRGVIVKDRKEVVRHYLWFGIARALRYVEGECTREVYQYFKTVQAFWTFLKTRLDKGRPLHVFCHNLGFDLTIVDFWLECERQGWKVTYSVLEDPPTFIGVEINGCTVNFIDTLNYWRTSLADLGKSFALDKLPMPAIDAAMEDWHTYCKRDVDILAGAVTGLIDYLVNNDLGSFGMTSPSIAMSVYKHRFMEYLIYVHDNVHALDLERSSYYGGLVSCFFIGPIAKGRVYHLDVNSLYPSVMLERFPTKFVRIDRHLTPAKLLRLMGEYGAAAKVRIKSDVNTYPLRWCKKLLDVRGEFVTYLCGAELMFALEQGDIASVDFAAFYDTDPIFTDYVNYFWNERTKFKAQGDNVKQTFCKLLMNSLYGKFGQKGFDWLELSPEVIAEIYQREGKKPPAAYLRQGFQPHIIWSQNKWQPEGLDSPLTIRAHGGLVQVRVATGEHSESCPIIAGYVTSYARQRVRDLIRIAGDRQVYYCDTDSLFVTPLGKHRLEKAGEVDNAKLGKLKLEGHADRPSFYGPKDYVFGDKEVIKGIRPQAIQVGEGEYIQNQFEGLKSVLHRKPDPFIEIRWVVKLNRRIFNKGLVSRGGWVKPFTSPHELPDSQLMIDDMD